jgi:uncharacterized protein
MHTSHRLAQVMRHHPLFFFYLMAYVFAWLVWLPHVLSQKGWPLESFHLTPIADLLVPLGSFVGPTLSAFIMTGVTEGKAGIGRLWHRYVLWRVGFLWYLFVLIGIPTLSLLSIFVLPGAIAAFRAPAPSFVITYLVSYVGVLLLGGPLGEEPGWRGFALPRWQQRSGPLVGTLLLGVLWGFWHFPLLLVLGYNGAGTGFVGISIPLAEFVISTVAFAVIWTWVFNNTRGSLLLVMLLHASLNTAINVFSAGLFSPFARHAPVQQSLDIVMIVVALLIILATRGRLSYQRYQRETAPPVPGTDEEQEHRSRNSPEDLMGKEQQER